MKLLLGNNLDLLKNLPDNSIDSVVTDPPYGLKFMGKKWDYSVPSIQFWQQIYRVLKPGGHILSFGGTRTYHRMVVNLEDAGFEIRDCISWLYGSGFPKSLNLGKAVDKIQGNEREIIGNRLTGTALLGHKIRKDNKIEDGWLTGQMMVTDTQGTSPWEGFGTALKPAQELICLARKPISESTIAENVLKWGTGGINVDGCRIGIEGDTRKSGIIKDQNNASCYGNGKGLGIGLVEKLEIGRFPANLILDEEAGKLLDEQSGITKTRPDENYQHNHTESKGEVFKSRGKYTPREDKGGASRFFYCPKVSGPERNRGLEQLEGGKVIRQGLAGENKNPIHQNNHPTVKPIKLMSYLCRLITPPNGLILDPFMGSGSTGIAAYLEGFDFIGMEMDPDYFKIAEARINHHIKST